jgi:glutamate carboxypeptidase
LGEQIGITLEEGMSGGASDGNLSNIYTPTLDGLGAVGDGAHAEHEHILVEKTIERTILLALLILEPSLD